MFPLTRLNVMTSETISVFLAVGDVVGRGGNNKLMRGLQLSLAGGFSNV